MLSIGKVRRGASGKRYYTRLSEEDAHFSKRPETAYYVGQTESQGVWVGRGAMKLGLSGAVDPEVFSNLFDGYSPTGEALSRNVNHKLRRPAFDACFSAPKGVSIVRAMAEPEIQAKMDRAMDLATRAAIDYLERAATFTRLGAQGAELVKGDGLTGAGFVHLISRGLDPDWHRHIVLFNHTEGPDGQFRTLDGSKLYDHKMAAGAIFRAELSYHLGQMFELERDRFSFDIKGVPDDLKEEFSSRARDIRQRLGDKEATARQKDRATLDTREPKRDVDREALTAEWQEVSKRHGFTKDSIRKLIIDHPPIEKDVGQEIRDAIFRAIDTFSKSGQSTLTERTLIQYAAVEAQTRGITANDARLSVWAALEHARRNTPGHSLVYLGVDKEGEQRFTTKYLFNLEQEILQIADSTRKDEAHCVSDRAIERALSKRPTIKAEQRDAVQHVTQTKGEIQIVCGWPGTGKTFMLDCARGAWEQSGYRVIGAAVGGKAARGLATEAHIKSDSVAKLLWDLNHPSPWAKFEQLNKSTVVVIDEAGQLGTEQLHELVVKCHAAKAKIVLIGDENQIQAIDAGGGFAGLAKRLGFAELKEITRQQDARDRQCVYDLAQGRAAKAIESYATRGRLSLGDDREETHRTLVRDWMKDGLPPEEKCILASTNAQCYEINALLQKERLERGELGPLSFRNGRETFHQNERILFTKRAKLYGIENGDLATITDYDPIRHAMTVRLDAGQTVTVPIAKVSDFRLGACGTTHKFQGTTVSGNAYVYIYGEMSDAQMFLVQASRARGETRLYSTKDEVGPELVDLIRDVGRDRKKHLAHDSVRELELTPKRPSPVRGHELTHEF